MCLFSLKNISQICSNAETKGMLAFFPAVVEIKNALGNRVGVVVGRLEMEKMPELVITKYQTTTMLRKQNTL